MKENPSTAPVVETDLFGSKQFDSHSQSANEIELTEITPISRLSSDDASITSTKGLIDPSSEGLSGIIASDSFLVKMEDQNPELTRFISACQNGDLSLVTEAITSGTVRATDCLKDNVTGLHWASINNHLEVVKYLLANPHSKANPNQTGGDLLATALHWACRQGLVSIAHYLMAHSTADPNLRDSQSYNALHLAVHTSNPIMVIYFLVTCVGKNCVKPMYVDEPDNSNRTALHWAAYQGDTTIINALLKFGADVSKVDNTLFVPIHWAFMVGNRFTLKALLEAGSDIWCKNNHGKDTFAIAADMNCLDLWHRVLRENDRSPRNNWEKRVHWISARLAKILTFLAPYLILPTVLYTCSFSDGFWALKVLVAILEVLVFVKLIDTCIIPIYLIDENALSKSPFLTGVFSSTAFWGIVIWLFKIVPSTYISRFFGNVSMAILTTLMTSAYYKTVFINPGIISSPADNSVRASPIKELIALNKFDSSHYCVHTLVRKPLRSKYSRITQHLVARFDHYCPWVYNDIGVRNHKLFVTFIYALAGTIFVFLRLSLEFFKNQANGYSSDDVMHCPLLTGEMCFAFQYHNFHFNFFIWCVIQFTWLVFLCLTQTFQICNGVTTFEFTKLGHGGAVNGIQQHHSHRNGFKMYLGMLGIDQLLHTTKVSFYSLIAKIAPNSSFTEIHLNESLESYRIPSDFGVIQNTLDFWVLGEVSFRNVFYLPIKGENNLNGTLVDYYQLFDWPVQPENIV